MYSIDGMNFQNSNVFTDLDNGNYTITVQDENNCTETTTATVAVNTLVVAASLVNDISCNNANDGSIQVMVSGGTMPFEYSINNGVSYQSSNTFENLATGTYTVIIRDSEGFTQTTNSVSITNPTAISLSANTNEYDITVNASGGTGTLMYSIDEMNFQTSNVFADLENGVYTITVQDENACTETTTAIIAVNSLVVAASLVNDISCNNANDASIEVTVVGGNPPYEYSIDGINFQTSNSFSNLSDGMYTITVQDNDGFTQVANSVTITNPTAINADASVSEDVITITANGGTGTLSYSIDGAIFQNSNVFGGLANDTYTITVQDENDCTVTTSATVLVNTLQVSASLGNDISCNGADNGSIEVTVTGGNMPFMYSIDGMNFQSSNLFENLAAGTYDIVVQDNDGFLQSTNSVSITNPTALTATAAVSDNSITVSASGGTGSLMYSLDGMNFQNSNIFENLDNGVYTITVQDENGCIETTTAIVAVNSLLVSADLVNDISCNDANDGNIQVNVAGGNPPFEYSIDGINFQDSNTFDNLSDGSYTVTVQDSDGFIQTSNSITLSNPEAISATASVDEDAITISASGGTGMLSYSIDGMNFQSSNVFMGLANGSYTISVMDENGCIETTTAIVAVNSLVATATLINDISCTDFNDASIEVAASGGLAPLEYSLDGSNFQSSNVFSDLSAGNYIVTVRDADGFTFTTNELVLNNPEILIINNIDINDNIITVDASGGTGELRYSIDGIIFQLENVFNNVANDDYVISVQDENGCITNSMTVTVFVPDPFIISSSFSTNISCHDANDGSINIQVSGGIPPYMFSLNNAVFQEDNLFSNLPAGTYTVIAEDATGISITSSTVTISNPEPISYTIDVNENTITINNVMGGTGAYMYSIDGGITLQESNEFINLESGDYVVGVIDENNCSSFEQVLVISTGIQLVNDLLFDLYPNPSSGIFTIKLQQSSLEDFQFQVFDMLGRLVYSSDAEQSVGLVQKTIDVSHLSDGTYQLKIQSEQRFGTQSIVILK